MLNMDQANRIRQLAVQGKSISSIAADTRHDRKTVRKYARGLCREKEPFKHARACKLDSYRPHIETLLAAQGSIRSEKHKLTARRIHTMLAEGTLCDELPAIEVSIRTTERLVAEIRSALKLKRNRPYLRLEHNPGEAQFDFGEVGVFLNGKTAGLIIAVLTLPYSNYRMVQALPAQNFECLALGLSAMLEHLGRTPTTVRFDNMSTAVSRIIRRKDVGKVPGVYDAIDHPRLLTENFKRLMFHFGFRAEFCNGASGYEKVSVENAVGWARRNFFVPLMHFDGDYGALNQLLLRLCDKAAEEPHYRRKEHTISELRAEDLAQMYELPDKPFEAMSWTEAKVNGNCRVSVDSNEYQLDALPGQRVVIRKSWNKLEFYDEHRNLLGESPRSYDQHKDFVDWPVEMKFLAERPSALKNSSFSKVLDGQTLAYLLRLPASGRAVLLRAFAQKLSECRLFEDLVRELENAVQSYSHLDVAAVASAFRGSDDTSADCVAPMKLPVRLGDRTLEQTGILEYSKVLGHA